ncbi:MAG: outer membrane beta-barrel protein, partial [Chitinophagaceae bacterium]
MKRMTCFLSLFFLLCSLMAYGQKRVIQPVEVAPSSAPASKPEKNTYEIKGKLMDSSNHQPLVSATVYVKNTKDSTIASLSLTDDKGNFVLKDIPRDQELFFSIYYTGYTPYNKILKNIKKEVLDFGTLYLSMASHTLNEVTIQGAAPPIAIKGDTIQFNASSFKTRPNSVLADLLKKLPGVEIDQNGNVTAMGEKVDRIEVDGKKFFGNDPKIALQNLPSAIVDKVQITDTKTTQEEMTGQPASGQTKTINITLKKGLDHGVFGRAYAGYGTGKHYDASALMNYFDGKTQLSLLGATNNINQVGFTVNEIQGIMNANGNTRAFGYQSGNGGINVGGVSLGPSQAGLNTTTTAGVNYNDDYGKHVSVNGSYFYGNTRLDNDTKTAQQNILPDSLFNYNSENVTHNDNLSHQATAQIVFHDSLWNIRYEPNINISNQTGTNLNNAVSTGIKGNLINQSNSLYTNNDETKTFNNGLYAFRKFKKKNQYFYFNLYASNQTTNGNDYNQYRNLFYTGSTLSDSVNQYINNSINNNNYRGYVMYSQPLSKMFSVNVGYQFQWQHSLNDKKTFDFDNSTGKFSSLDSVYSNRFRSNILTQAPNAGITLMADSGRWRVTAGAKFNFIGLHHYSYTYNIAFNQNQFFVTPTFNFSHQFKNKSYLSLYYYSFVNQPDISQLLPVADNSNPLYITKGNPDLKPSVYNGIQMYYNKYDFKSGNAVFLRLGYNFTQNDIVNVTTYSPQLTQTSTYKNVNGDNGINFNIDLSKTKKTANYHWQIKLGSYGNMGNNHAFVNDQPYTSKSYSAMLRPSVTYGYKDLFEFTPSYSFNYQLSKYDINSLNSRQSMIQQAGLSGTIYWPKRFTWTSDWTYTHNSDVAPGFRKGFILWNGS